MKMDEKIEKKIIKSKLVKLLPLQLRIIKGGVMAKWYDLPKTKPLIRTDIAATLEILSLFGPCVSYPISAETSTSWWIGHFQSKGIMLGITISKKGQVWKTWASQNVNFGFSGLDSSSSIFFKHGDLARAYKCILLGHHLLIMCCHIWIFFQDCIVSTSIN
ncbi:hypothetical protein ACJX0J_006324 [Zea mays]